MPGMLPRLDSERVKKGLEKRRDSSERRFILFVLSSFFVVSRVCLVPGHAAWNRRDGKTSQAEKVRIGKTGRSGRQRNET